MSTPVTAERLGPVVPPGLAERLIHWQQRHGRHHLPWQGTRDPYRVWLSEIMLQQTQVSTVLAYYERFLVRFPTVQVLAEAPLDDVLAHWSGLGYYSRARHLHRCAQTVVARHAGSFPADAATLETLPGIGRSTAAAIAAFCFGERAAILDGNVKRVLTRVLAFEDDLADSPAVERLWRLAEALLPEAEIGRYTQGLMDLGATLCRRTRPDCGACPWQGDCAAHAQGRPEAFPVKTRRLKRGERHSALLWLRQGSRQWMVRRPDSGVWAGLWTLPVYDNAADLAEQAATWPGEGEVLPAIRHGLTHFEWTLAPLRWQLPVQLSAADWTALSGGLPEGRWVDDAEALSLGLPAPVRKLLLEADKSGAIAPDRNK